MEDEPRDELSENMDITLNGEPFEVNRRVASLFTFIGANAIKNHVFLVLEDNDDGTCEGTHIWEEFMYEAYVALENHIIAHDYPQHLNMNAVSQIDEDAFERAISVQFADLNDYIPEDFKLGTEDDNGKTATDE